MKTVGSSSVEDQTNKMVIFTIITGVIALVADTLAILLAFGIPNLSVANITITIPKINIDATGTINDVNLTFAGIIYACVTLGVASYQISQLLHRFIMTFLPPVLLVLWSTAYFRAEEFIWVVLLTIALSNIWVSIFLRRYSDSMYEHWFILPLLLFPTNALILIGLASVPALGSWITAFIIFLFSMIISFSSSNMPEIEER